MTPKDLVAYSLWLLLSSLALGGVWLFFDRSALRDESTGHPAPYSFARTQLLWWVLVILGCVIGSYLRTRRLWEMSESCLILLGISAGTGATARLVDSRDRLDPRIAGRMHQNSSSQGFWRDVLSDENGLSVHRFQAAVFNIFFGVTFVEQTFADLDAKTLPNFDSVTLALIGLSSATYVTIKSMENKASDAKPAPSASASDELLDPIEPGATELVG
jgi:energy-coupling factor transporter transmembrane protein EcfT